MGVYTNLFAKELFKVLTGPRIDGVRFSCERPSLLVPVSKYNQGIFQVISLQDICSSSDRRRASRRMCYCCNFVSVSEVDTHSRK